MLELDEEISKTWESYTYPSGEFYEARAVRHYRDTDFNPELFDLLEAKIDKQYKDRKNIRIMINSFKTKKETIGIWVTTTFTEKEDYFSVVKDVLEEFEQSYEKFKKETEEELRKNLENNILTTPKIMRPRFKR